MRKAIMPPSSAIMNEVTLGQIERLLTPRAPDDYPENLEHRYALRRALLNSSLFERNRVCIVWTRAFMATTLVVAGGAVGVVLAVNVLTLELREPRDTTFVRQRARQAEFVSIVDRPEVRHALDYRLLSASFVTAR
jgi:hypothetical protein